VQKRLGYCPDPYVAEMELRLERDGHWEAFKAAAERTLGKSWDQAKNEALADDQFSQVMHALFPERFVDPMAWIVARAGTPSTATSGEEATRAIRDMLEFRAKGKTLFVVVDEISQYVYRDHERMLKLQSFVTGLGQRLKGKVWLLVTGQKQLEDTSDDQDVLGKMKDRFPERLRVHLSATNIRDVVHKRLLTKKKAGVEVLRELFRKHRNDLRLFAYDCDDITEEDFIEVYPLLPGHIDLILQITSALRTRSTRSQGDDQTIRGLLQLLGELFRSQKLADAEVGALVTLDRVYEIQHTALDSDVQNSMARVLHYCDQHGLTLAARAAKAVALLELIQDQRPTDAKLVAACLYDRLDLGSQEEKVAEALEELRRHNLLGYSEKHGYKVQSSAGEEWERERRDVRVPFERISEVVREQLKLLVADPEQPKMKGQKFPWRAFFSDGRGVSDAQLTSGRDPASIKVDLRLVLDREPNTWVNRSAESTFSDRILWVVGESDDLETAAREFCRSDIMVRSNKPRRESLTRERQRLLFEEEGRLEELQTKLKRAVDQAFTNGDLYFRGKRTQGRDLGASFGQVLTAISERVLPELFHAFVAPSGRISDAEVMQLIEVTLNAPSPVFVKELGILSLDAGKYEPTCHGVVPRGIEEYIKAENGVSGARLLEHFGGPPYGYAPEMVRACVAGLLRSHRVRIQPEGGQEISAVRDAGTRDVFEKDRDFKRATIFPAGDDAISPKDRARICKLFENRLGQRIDREPDAIAEAVAQHFPRRAEVLRDVYRRLDRLPRDTVRMPYALEHLDQALTRCVSKSRNTEPTVRECLKQLDVLNDGLALLARLASELTDEAIEAVRRAYDVAHYQGKQLEELGDLDEAAAQALAQVREQLTSEKPWVDIVAIEPHLNTLREAYRARRKQLLRAQEEAAEDARRELKARAGFATLTADQAHHVLKPISEVLAGADGEALQPTLLILRDGYQVNLRRALEEANERLDQILSSGAKPAIRKLPLNLHNREITSPEELEQLLQELRARVLEQLEAGVRVRLV
jgi:hypothetical protein